MNCTLAYGSGVYSNLGNYKGYGDTKIVPDLELKHFEAIVHGSEAFKNDPITLHNLWNSVKGRDLYIAITLTTGHWLSF